MRNLLTGDDLYAQLLMLRAINKSTVLLLLEGESDCKALESHLDETSVQPIPGHGKATILKAMKNVNETAVPRVLAIVDRDLDGVIGPEPGIDNVVCTDNYDLDADIFYAGAVVSRVVASSCGLDAPRADLRSQKCPSIVMLATRLILPLAIVRVQSIRDRYGLRIRKFPVHRAFETTAIKLIAEVTATILIAQSTNPAIDHETLTAILAAEIDRTKKQEEADPRRLCCGHDLIAALAVLMTKRWNANVHTEQLAQSLRAAFAPADLASTGVFARVAAWAEAAGTQVWNLPAY